MFLNNNISMKYFDGIHFNEGTVTVNHTVLLRV